MNLNSTLDTLVCDVHITARSPCIVKVSRPTVHLTVHQFHDLPSRHRDVGPNERQVRLIHIGPIQQVPVVVDKAAKATGACRGKQDGATAVEDVDGKVDVGGVPQAPVARRQFRCARHSTAEVRQPHSKDDPRVRHCEVPGAGYSAEARVTCRHTSAPAQRTLRTRNLQLALSQDDLGIEKCFRRDFPSTSNKRALNAFLVSRPSLSPIPNVIQFGPKTKICVIVCAPVHRGNQIEQTS